MSSVAYLGEHLFHLLEERADVLALETSERAIIPGFEVALDCGRVFASLAGFAGVICRDNVLYPDGGFAHRNIQVQQPEIQYFVQDLGKWSGVHECRQGLPQRGIQFPDIGPCSCELRAGKVVDVPARY